MSEGQLLSQPNLGEVTVMPNHPACNSLGQSMTAAFLAFLGLFSLFASQTPGKISPSFGSTPFRKPAQQAKCKLGEPVTLKGTFVVFSPDGNDFVTNSSEEGPGLHEARSGRLIRRFQIEPPCRVVDARFSPDGQFITIACWEQFFSIMVTEGLAY